MSKALSNGTLSLRFMQNAQRAKQQAHIEAEQAQVKDEAEWEVSQEIKDAWGVSAPSVSGSSVVSYEASYVPFLFPLSSDGPGEVPSRTEPPIPRRLNGRRTFNGDGKEVMPDTKADVKPDGEGPSNTDQEPPPVNKRLKSISGFQAPLSTKLKDSKRTKTAQMLIREDNRRALPRPPPQSSDAPQDKTVSTPAPTGFLKPAGVDVPSTSGRPSSSSKRIREGDPNDAVGIDGKKRKKKRDLA